jgi:hypothetical protein
MRIQYRISTTIDCYLETCQGYKLVALLVCRVWPGLTHAVGGCAGVARSGPVACGNACRASHAVQRSRVRWFYGNTHLLHGRFPESTRVGGSAGAMLVLWHACAVCTADTTTSRVLLRCVARQRDTRDHLFTEGQQPQRIFSRNHGWEACGDRIEILDRFREEPCPHGQRKEVSVSYEETPAPIDATDLLGQRLWHETPHPIHQWIGGGMFRPAHTHAVDILAAWLQQPSPKSC